MKNFYRHCKPCFVLAIVLVIPAALGEAQTIGDRLNALDAGTSISTTQVKAVLDELARLETAPQSDARLALAQLSKALELPASTKRALASIGLVVLARRSDSNELLSESMPAIFRQLDDKQEPVSKNVGLVLAYADPRCFLGIKTPMIEYLHASPQSDKSPAVIRGLVRGFSHDEDAVSQISSFIGNPEVPSDIKARGVSAASIAQLDDPRLIKLIRASMNSEGSLLVRVAALRGIRSLGPNAIRDSIKELDYFSTDTRNPTKYRVEALRAEGTSEALRRAATLE